MQYALKIRVFLNTFIKDALGYLYAREHIRAIVPAGEASGPAFAEILKIAYDVVGNDNVSVLNNIDPALVVAHGAAMYVHDTVLTKGLKEHSDSSQRDQGMHDEL